MSFLARIKAALGALRDRLVDDWKQAHKFWSVRFAAASAVAQGFLLTIPDSAATIWGALPDDIKAVLPEHFANWLPLFLAFASIAARIFKQKNIDGTA